MIFVGVIDVLGCLPQYSVPVNFDSRRNLNKNTVFHLKRLSTDYHRFNLRKQTSLLQLLHENLDCLRPTVA